jgi:hypothetical protein
MKTLRALTLCTWACVAGGVGSAAYGAQLGPYVGAAYGVTERDLDQQPFDDFFLNGFYPASAFVPNTHVSSIDTKDKGYMGVIGYRITAHWAVEGVFLDLGEITYRSTADGELQFEELDNMPYTINSTITGKVSGIGLHGLAIWPINYRWELYARGGVQFTSPRLRGRINNGLIDFRPDSATDFLGGVGVAMSVLDVYGIRLEYLRVLDAGDSGPTERDVDFISLGFIVAF